jgi:hypothetical protein
MFTEPFPSNGYMRYNIFVPNLFFIFSSAFVYIFLSVSILGAFDFLPSHEYWW